MRCDDFTDSENLAASSSCHSNCDSWTSSSWKRCYTDSPVLGLTGPTGLESAFHKIFEQLCEHDRL